MSGAGTGMGRAPGAAPEAAAVEVRALSRDHAGEKALKEVTFTVPHGALFGIIGADGAGKSTLMGILATLADPDSGGASVLGLDLLRDFSRLRRHIGYMPQRFSLYPDLSVGENLDFFADIFGIAGAEKRDRTESLLAFAALGPFKDRRAGDLSGGMKQKLALACTLIHKPRLLLLDEPTVGVDPVARRDFWTLLRALRNEGVTLLVSTPYMDEAALCDRLLLLHGGRILAEGTPADLKAAYPYRIYQVEADPGGSGRPLHYPADQAPPAGLALLYPAAGALHAAAFRSSDSPGADSAGAGTGPRPEALVARLRAVVPEAGSARVVEPTVEDVFFALLSAAEPSGGGP